MFRDAELRQRSRAGQIMPMSALRPHTWTVDDVERLAQQRAGVVPRYELMDGELLVTPAPDARHQRIVFHLGLALQEYLSRERVGEIRLGPAEVRLSADTRFEPDLFVVAAIDGRFPAAGAEVSQPLLACDVLSLPAGRMSVVYRPAPTVMRTTFERNPCKFSKEAPPPRHSTVCTPDVRKTYDVMA